MNMIYIDLKDDLSEKMVYDYPDCPAYTIHEMLSHYPIIPLSATGMMTLNF